MKRTAIILIFLTYSITIGAQISINADSMVISKWDLSRGGNYTVKSIKENMSIEIDKDLLTLRVFGTTEEKAYIEKAYIIDLLEVNNNKDKWLFQGADKNCVPCTITLDVNNKKISFITLGKEYGVDRPLNTIYYTIASIKINLDAIEKHLKEKSAQNLRE